MTEDSLKNASIAYIMGYGRSGSTFLDILLSAHAEIVSVGALSNFFAWMEDNLDCACGSPFEQCEFWSHVYQDLCKSLDCHDLHRYKKNQLSVESRTSISKLMRGRLPSTVTSEYSALMNSLFGSIVRESGKRIIVDSSKSAGETAGRAFALKKHTSFDVKLIHLVRDVRGTIWSAIKGPGSPERSQSQLVALRALKTGIGWITANALCLFMASQLEPNSVLLVRYEDLVSDPRNELVRIGSHLQIDTTQLIAKIDAGTAFTSGHNLGGNRLRFASEVTVKPDFEWMRKLPRKYRIGFGLLTWPLARKFDYHLVP